jgi:hypothetical protein
MPELRFLKKFDKKHLTLSIPIIVADYHLLETIVTHLIH